MNGGFSDFDCHAYINVSNPRPTAYVMGALPAILSRTSVVSVSPLQRCTSRSHLYLSSSPVDRPFCPHPPGAWRFAAVALLFSSHWVPFTAVLAFATSLAALRLAPHDAGSLWC
jgi:hypothetical protein